MSTPYTSQFYRQYLLESQESARRILALVHGWTSPRSVVDVGCGIGTWLAVWRELGVERYLGVDGDHVTRADLMIPSERFRPADLAQPLRIDERFDVACSLEVAEHLPAGRAPHFVADLVALAPIVLFSAAIPHQGGDLHINEQWPEYWAALFAAHGYVCLDCIRPAVWEDESVAYYYAQNAFLFVAEARHREHGVLSAFPAVHSGLSKVHPRKWQEANDPRRQPLRPLLRAVPHSLGRTVRRRLGL